MSLVITESRVRLVDLFVTDHARARARERLGVDPPQDWWERVGRRVASGALAPSGEGDRPGVYTYRVPAVDQYGVELDLAVVVKRTHCGNGDFRVGFVTIWTPLEDKRLHVSAPLEDHL